MSRPQCSRCVFVNNNRSKNKLSCRRHFQMPQANWLYYKDVHEFGRLIFFEYFGILWVSLLFFISFADILYISDRDKQLTQTRTEK